MRAAVLTDPRTYAGFAVAVLLLLGMLAHANAAEPFKAPSAAEIEQLLRETLADRKIFVPALYSSPDFKNFKLRKLDGELAPRWEAEVEMDFEYATPGPGLIGFQRKRHGRFWLVIQQRGEEFEIRRFVPIAEVQLLPARQPPER